MFFNSQNRSFCRSLKHCADMCVLMRRHLGPHITDPPGLSSDLQHRLIDVFTAASDSDVREEVLKEFCKVTKQIRGEMNSICSVNYNSVIRSEHENIKHFSWGAIWNEFTQKLPTLVLFLQKLLPKSDNRYLSFLICV